MRESLPFDTGRQFLPTSMSAKGMSETVRESNIPPQVIYSDEEHRFNSDITVGLIRRELLNLAEYNIHIAKLVDGGKDSM